MKFEPGQTLVGILCYLCLREITTLFTVWLDGSR